MILRKTMIVFATVASLGAASAIPAAAAGPNAGAVAAIAQSKTSKAVEISDRGGRNHRYDRGRDYRRDHGRRHWRGHGRGYGRPVCRVRPTKIVRWTPRGKIVRIVPRETCFFGGGRRRR